MRCPSCGAPCQKGAECLECGALAVVSEPNVDDKLKQARRRARRSAKAGTKANTNTTKQTRRNSTLIEFPGVPRSSVPQWRKELSERVREVHEKRAREAALEDAELEQQRKEQSAVCLPQLELLPQGDVAQVNPLVKAALRRIERANQVEPPVLSHAPNTRPAALQRAADADSQDPAYQTLDLGVAPSVPVADAELTESSSADDESTQSDKLHNLVVVPRGDAEANGAEVKALIEANLTVQVKAKPRRVITEDPNHPALNYLDSIPTAARVKHLRQHRAPMFSRLLCAGIDLIVVAILCSPFAVVMGLPNENWQNLHTAIVAAAVISMVAFLYLTITTAFTGRTLAMRLFSLRVVDERTGLIPTGNQSAGRALIYVASLFTLGVAILFALTDPEKRTAHDRLTHTAVIVG